MPAQSADELADEQERRLEALQARDFDTYKRMLEQQRGKESVLVEGYRQIQVRVCKERFWVPGFLCNRKPISAGRY